MSDFWAMALVWCIPGIFGLKLVFWDIPLRHDSYWKGLSKGLIGAAVLTALVFTFTNYFIFGLVAAFIALIIFWASRS